MAMTQVMVEEVTAWCRDNLELADARRDARAHFFGDDDERPVSYWGGADDFASKERRFLGYFLFHHNLPSEEKPSEVASKRLYRGTMQSDALESVAGARFVLAAVSHVAGRDVELEQEDKRFEVRNAQWGSSLRKGAAMAVHLLPVRHRYWLLGPGWVTLPFAIGPGMRSALQRLQMDPIMLERMLQGRVRQTEALNPYPEANDDSLEAAVARLTGP